MFNCNVRRAGLATRKHGAELDRAEGADVHYDGAGKSLQDVTARCCASCVVNATL